MYVVLRSSLTSLTTTLRLCTTTTKYPYGLYDKSDTQFCRTNLSLPDAANILDDTTLFWNAAKADIDYANAHCASEDTQELTVEDYLTRVQSSSEDFITSGFLEDREEILANLSSLLFRKKGKFVLYLGGKSTGKSTTLRDIVRRTNDAKDPLFGLPVSLIDGRESPDLTELLLNVLPPDFVEDYLNRRLPTLKKYWTAGKKNAAVMLSFVPVIGEKLKNAVPQTGPTPREIIIDYISHHKSKPDRKLPIIIIDEANRFMEDAGHDKTKHQQLKSVLELFALSTKQTHDLHVILAASEHAFPYRLNEIGGGNFSANFTNYIFAGEIPPGSMYNLLTKKWGMGENLATAFLNCYGGHVWMCSLAVDALLTRKEDFSAMDILGSATTSGILSCLASKSEDMLEMLEGVAKDGYFPLELKHEPHAKAASEKNILGAVNARSLVVGVPLAIRKKKLSVSGVIPASQVTRLLIARELYPPAQAPAT